LNFSFSFSLQIGAAISALAISVMGLVGTEIEVLIQWRCSFILWCQNVSILAGTARFQAFGMQCYFY